MNKDKKCVEKCPPGSFRVIGDFICEEAPGTTVAEHSVSFSGTTYNYVYLYAVSYTSVDWSVRKSHEPKNVAAFLEAEGQLMYLRLRATVDEEDIQYAPVVFFAVQTVLSSELQLTAKAVASSFILAVVLMRDTRILSSYVFATFEGSGTYETATRKCEHVVALAQSIVDLNEGVSAGDMVRE